MQHLYSESFTSGHCFVDPPKGCGSEHFVDESSIFVKVCQPRTPNPQRFPNMRYPTLKMLAPKATSIFSVPESNSKTSIFEAPALLFQDEPASNEELPVLFSKRGFDTPEITKSDLGNLCDYLKHLYDGKSPRPLEAGAQLTFECQQPTFTINMEHILEKQSHNERVPQQPPRISGTLCQEPYSNSGMDIRLPRRSLVQANPPLTSELQKPCNNVKNKPVRTWAQRAVKWKVRAEAAKYALQAAAAASMASDAATSSADQAEEVEVGARFASNSKTEKVYLLQCFLLTQHPDGIYAFLIAEL